MSVYRLIVLSVMALASPLLSGKGTLRVQVEATGQAGQALPIVTQAVQERKGQVQVQAGVMDGREMRFELQPYRFNLFEDRLIPVTAEGSGEQRRLRLPADLATGWYVLVAVAADDEGRVPSVSSALGDRTKKNLVDRRVIAVRGKQTGPFVQVHTERARCVFSPVSSFVYLSLVVVRRRSAVK